MVSRRKGFLAGGVAGAALACGALVWAAGHSPGAIADAMAPTAGIAAPGAPMSFADIIAKVSPAVVSIDVSGKADASEVALQGGVPFPFGGGGDEDGQGGQDGAQNPFFRFFQIPPGAAGPAAPAPRMQATGSGFFISPDGYIVTNNHVIRGADTITVRTADKRVLKGHVVGHDPATDIAVVKVDGSGFPFVRFEDAGRPRVGDWVVAVGNPFGLGGTATAGIVSALSRDNVADASLVNYMQIDAPINRGNSGGPTFDVYGRVVGVNTAIYSPTGGSVGIGFDIPADVAQSVSRQLIAKGRIEHGYIGASIQGLTPDLADSLGLKTTDGALVAGLAAGGPAERSGLKIGDVITAVDGRSVTSASDLTRQVAFSNPGASLRLSLLRDGRPQTLTLTAGIRPSDQQLARADYDAPEGGAGEDASGAAPVLGMRLSALTEAERQRFNLNDDARGVVVEKVGAQSNAAEAGLSPGDVIVRAGDHRAERPADVAAAVADAKRLQRKSVLLMVEHGGRNIFVPIPVAPQAQG